MANGFKEILDKNPTFNTDLVVQPGDIQGTSDQRTQMIDQLSKKSGFGNISTANGDMYYGINHRQIPQPIQINKDVYGLTFFTRPELNLSTENLRTVRQFVPLLTNDDTSIPRIIRCMLDRQLSKVGISSPLFDDQQAFLPILTNNLLSISGWPDVVAPDMTSQPGVYQEAFSMIDGTTKIYTTYNLQANFRNVPGDPITTMIAYWLHYASLAYEGVIVPYPTKIIQNEIDYMTRIYRLVMDVTKTKVQKIAACGAAFPLSAPTGAAFDVEQGAPYTTANQQLSISFRAIGAIYNDPILIYTFNQTVVMFNDTMGDNYRESMYTQVPINLLPVFNNRGYPRINPDTWELEWWVENALYQTYTATYK